MKILALDIGGTAVKSGMFIDGQLTFFEEFSTEAKCGAQLMVDRICAYICNNAPDAVGISTSGQVNPKEGSIAFATDAMPGYTGFPLRTYVSAQTGLPVVVDNDVNCAAIGEAYFGATKGIKDFLCLTIGTGIGGALFVGGRLYHGVDGIAGEVGHITTHRGGLPCTCGRKGCYEAYASTSALIRMAEKSLGRKTNGRELFEARKEPTVNDLFNIWADEVVVGLVSLTHCINPEAIVLGGGLMSQPEIFSLVEEKYKAELLPSFGRTKLLPAKLGNQAGMYGAYVIAQNNLLNLSGFKLEYPAGF